MRRGWLRPFDEGGTLRRCGRVDRLMVPADASEFRTRPGCGQPLGAVVDDGGVQFSVVSRHASRVWLCLFAAADDGKPFWEFELRRDTHHFGDVWSVYVEGIGAGVLYTFRMAGPRRRHKIHRFKRTRYLLDPYAMAVVGAVERGGGKCVAVRACHGAAKAGRPREPLTRSVIYETHVRGLTAHESAGVVAPGTYAGLIEKIPYLKELGVTAVELLPVQECGEREIGRVNPITGDALTNYWGYNPIAFSAPTGRYARDAGRGGQVDEFRRMVAALHEADIEVILDVVFNHTAEGWQDEPALGFRGIDNVIYYLHDASGEALDLTGCRNTVNCNHPVVRDLIVDSLRHWVMEYGVDGFRFDLAAVLQRDRTGALLDRSPLIERITEDPILRGVRLIAEPWDLAGGHLVG
ncbi:MAG: glycogen debranching enzyme, partial [Candidatus Hydrogenedentes bacterium]|nr:glycogen debranching enzyme [Candidatus Hydrogenedentota bacterium]